MLEVGHLVDNTSAVPDALVADVYFNDTDQGGGLNQGSTCPHIPTVLSSSSFRAAEAYGCSRVPVSEACDCVSCAQPLAMLVVTLHGLSHQTRHAPLHLCSLLCCTKQRSTVLTPGSSKDRRGMNAVHRGPTSRMLLG
eukprot:3237509-Amphidinium_carterae.1